MQYMHLTQLYLLPTSLNTIKFAANLMLSDFGKIIFIKLAVANSHSLRDQLFDSAQTAALTNRTKVPRSSV